MLHLLRKRSRHSQNKEPSFINASFLSLSQGKLMENVGLKPSEAQDAQMLVTSPTEPCLPGCAASPLWPLGSLHTKGLDDFKVLCVMRGHTVTGRRTVCSALC